MKKTILTAVAVGLIVGFTAPAANTAPADDDLAIGLHRHRVNVIVEAGADVRGEGRVRGAIGIQSSDAVDGRTV